MASTAEAPITLSLPGRRGRQPRRSRKEDSLPQYTLPDLRCGCGAFEPHVSGRIMELHHDKHHAADVKKANAALEQLDEAGSRTR
jgi:hypothetical protein